MQYLNKCDEKNQKLCLENIISYVKFQQLLQKIALHVFFAI